MKEGILGKGREVVMHCYVDQQMYGNYTPSRYTKPKIEYKGYNRYSKVSRRWVMSYSLLFLILLQEIILL